MNNLNIKLLSDNATTPTRAYGVSAGLDIYAAEEVEIEPQEKILLATDIAVDIPEGYVGLLTSRSGVSSKTHLVVETGKIDAGYNGHMRVNIKNDKQILDIKEYAYFDIKNNLDCGYVGEPVNAKYVINKGKGSVGKMIPKFRAWDKVNKEMIEDVASIHFKTEMIVTSNLCFYPFKDIELLQSTGLLDKNGTEIYDGDILQVSRNHTKTDERYFNNEKINYVIEFVIYDDMEAYADIEHNGWCAVSETHTSRCTLIDAVTLWRGTVVGNIYEHPHLLGEE